MNTKVRIKDMTQGNPLPLILNFAIPLFIGNIFQQIYSIVDTMVAGYNLGDQAIAAIGATSALYGLIIDFAMGMNSGYGIVVTRCFGAQNEKDMKQSIAGMMVLNGIAAVVLTTLSLLFMKPLMGFMNTPDAIFSQAYLYITIICAGMISTIAYNMFAAILRAVGNSRSPLYFLIIACVINIILDVLFVAVLRFGVAGTAIATVIAQTVSALLCGIYVFKHYEFLLPAKKDFRVSKTLLMDLLSTGSAMALMLCVVDLGSVIFQRANNLLGETIIAAHTAARRIIVIMMQPLGTIATANSTFVGQNWGARKTDRIRAGLKSVLIVEVLWSVFAGSIILFFGEAIVRFTTGTPSPEIVENAVLSMNVHLLFFPALGILLCLRTTMQAVGYKVAPVISSCIELGMKMLAAWWVIPSVGFIGTCFTEPVTWVVMMVYLVIAYFLQRKKMFG